MLVSLQAIFGREIVNLLLNHWRVMTLWKLAKSRVEVVLQTLNFTKLFHVAANSKTQLAIVFFWQDLVKFGEINSAQMLKTINIKWKYQIAALHLIFWIASNLQYTKRYPFVTQPFFRKNKHAAKKLLRNWL